MNDYREDDLPARLAAAQTATVHPLRMVALRLLLTLPILLGVSIVAFVLMRALPGDFAQASAGTTTISPEALDQLRRNLGLDRPVWEQYLAWLARALSGDLGTSFATKRPVLGELVPRFMVTAELTLVAGAMALALGGATGLASARLRGRVEWIVRGWNSLLLAVPNFVVATLVVLLFGLYFPTIGIFNYVPFATDPLGNLASMVLPGISLALTVSVTISENTRAAILEVASQDFVMVARAKGLSRGTILFDSGKASIDHLTADQGMGLAGMAQPQQAGHHTGIASAVRGESQQGGGAAFLLPSHHGGGAAEVDREGSRHGGWTPVLT
jgi:peptide/nickel transport system permease protein